MKDLSDFSDVLAKDVTVEETTALEFEFGNFVLRRERNHWQAEFFSEQGEEAVVVEREDFIDGKFTFDIDGKPECLLLEDFDRIEKFAYDKGLIGSPEEVVFGMTKEDIVETAKALLERDKDFDPEEYMK